MYTALNLGAGGPQLEPNLPILDGLLQLGDAADTDVLQRVLNADVEVGQESLDASLVLDIPRDTLSDLDGAAF